MSGLPQHPDLYYCGTCHGMHLPQSHHAHPDGIPDAIIQAKWAEIAARRRSNGYWHQYWCIGPVLEVGYGRVKNAFYLWASYGSREWHFPRNP